MENNDPRARKFTESLLSDYGMKLDVEPAPTSKPLIGSMSVKGNVIFVGDVSAATLDAIMAARRRKSGD